jgi:hypothetical protein
MGIESIAALIDIFLPLIVAKRLRFSVECCGVVMETVRSKKEEREPKLPFRIEHKPS